MRNFLKGVVVGTVLGYVFHPDIDKGVRKVLSDANERFADTDAGQVKYSPASTSGSSEETQP